MLTENWLPKIRRTMSEFEMIPPGDYADVVLIGAWLANRLPGRRVQLRVNVLPDPELTNAIAWPPSDLPFCFLRWEMSPEGAKLPVRPEARREAQESIAALLNEATEHMLDVELVTLLPDVPARLRAFGQMVEALTRLPLPPRDHVRDLCRIFAFMSGVTEAEESHVRLTMRVLFAQLPLPHQRALAFALHPSRRATSFRMVEMTAAIGSATSTENVRKIALISAGMLAKAGRYGKYSHYRATPLARVLANEFDADGRLFNSAEMVQCGTRDRALGGFPPLSS